MKKFLLVTILATNLASTVAIAHNPIAIIEASTSKLDIKIKNDSDDEVTVINIGSGGTYRLSKNVITTIKMNDGDKLFIYEGGKKGRLLLTASSDLNGKVQLLSKL
ncbi:MAG: hypothetical protein JST36_11070 [Bacteroidetes bacterium]|nr:hypothetical protein [Bacteroidota bacterium]